MMIKEQQVRWNQNLHPENFQPSTHEGRTIYDCGIYPMQINFDFNNHLLGHVSKFNSQTPSLVIFVSV